MKYTHNMLGSEKKSNAFGVLLSIQILFLRNIFTRNYNIYIKTREKRTISLFIKKTVQNILGWNA
jgi:hypothetical protein